MNDEGYISLQDALNLMDELYKEDMEEGGGIEWLETFDAKRAKNRLKLLPRYVDIVRPVRCGVCIFKKECFTPDAEEKGNGFKVYDCEELPGGYLGENGYCSRGKRKEK